VQRKGHVTRMAHLAGLLRDGTEQRPCAASPLPRHVALRGLLGMSSY
jgi:hypothetical protein